MVSFPFPWTGFHIKATENISEWDTCKYLKDSLLLNRQILKKILNVFGIIWRCVKLWWCCLQQYPSLNIYSVSTLGWNLETLLELIPQHYARWQALNKWCGGTGFQRPDLPKFKCPACGQDIRDDWNCIPGWRKTINLSPGCEELPVLRSFPVRLS